MDSMFNTPQEVVQANMNGAVKKLQLLKRKFFSWESWLVSASRLAHSPVMLPCMILQMSVLHVWLPAAFSGWSDDDRLYRRRIVHR